MKYTTSNPPMKCIMTNSTCYRNTTTMTIRGVLWHCTGANNPNLKRYVQPSENDANYKTLITKIGTNTNKNDWNHAYVNAGVNAWIGKLADGSVTTLQTLPWNYKPWGCASGKNGSCNNGWIQFEICEDALTDKTYFDKCYKEACELTAFLCKLYNINPKAKITYNGVSVPTILCHWDSYKLGLGSGHSDVYNWFDKFGKTMDNVRNDVAALMNATTTAPEVKPNVTIKYPELPFIAAVATADVVYRKEPAINSAVIGRTGKGSFTIVKVENNFGFLKSGAGWIDLTDSAVTVKNTVVTQTPAPAPIAGTPSTGSADDEKMIWKFLLSKIGNEYGVAGLMGNLYAESALKSNNLQNGYETKLGYTDVTYTEAVDKEAYNNFVKDSAGYGLAQWTYYSRKEKLLNFAKEKKISIGDCNMQLEFLCKELSESYKDTWDTLKNAKTVKEASNVVLLKFERPADQSEAVQTKRAGYGQNFYNKYNTKPAEPVKNNTYVGKGIGFAVSNTDVHIRNGASTIYSSLYILPKGQKVEVLEKTSSGWYKIVWPDASVGYAYTSNMNGTNYTYTPNVVTTNYKVKIDTDVLRVRKGPGTNYDIATTVKKGEVFTIVGESENWGKLKSGAGWICLDYTKRV